MCHVNKQIGAYRMRYFSEFFKIYGSPEFRPKPVLLPESFCIPFGSVSKQSLPISSYGAFIKRKGRSAIRKTSSFFDIISATQSIVKCFFQKFTRLCLLISKHPELT